MDKPVVFVALKPLPYDVVAADIVLVGVDVGEIIVCTDDELINVSPGDAVDTRFVETVCAFKADIKVRFPSVVVLDDEGITVAVIGSESVTSVNDVVFGSGAVVVGAVIDSVTVIFGGVRDSVTGIAVFVSDSVMVIGFVVRDSLTGKFGVVCDSVCVVKSFVDEVKVSPDSVDSFCCADADCVE